MVHSPGAEVSSAPGRRAGRPANLCSVSFSGQHHTRRLRGGPLLSGPVERRSGQAVQLRRPGHLDSDRRSADRGGLRGACRRLSLHLKLCRRVSRSSTLRLRSSDAVFLTPLPALTRCATHPHPICSDGKCFPSSLRQGWLCPRSRPVSSVLVALLTWLGASQPRAAPAPSSPPPCSSGFLLTCCSPAGPCGAWVTASSGGSRCSHRARS